MTERELAKILIEGSSILQDLLDDDPCWHDHHGNCQAHGWTDNEIECPHSRGKKFFEKFNKHKKEIEKHIKFKT